MTSYKNKYLELMLTMKRASNLLQKVDFETEEEINALLSGADDKLAAQNEVLHKSVDEEVRPKLVLNRTVIGGNIRSMRQKHSLTIEELAKELKISTAYLGLIERGERNVTLRKLCMLSNIFHTPMEDFLRIRNVGNIDNEAKAQ